MRLMTHIEKRELDFSIIFKYHDTLVISLTQHEQYEQIRRKKLRQMITRTVFRCDYRTNFRSILSTAKFLCLLAGLQNYQKGEKR